METARRTNRLAGEKSPYLLQHQFNPVDWHPWGQEAFALARRLNRPIFLSIGYSTCHWCHVMERESFENPVVAELLNLHFVSVKVDREERPDVDKVYMTAAQAMTGQGGWPLSVFLTPDLSPFFCGTYFPPETRFNRPGFPDLLRQIHRVWRERRQDVEASAEDLRQRLREMLDRQPAAKAVLHPGLVHQALQVIKQDFDPEHGGFGVAPKFPQPSLPALLLQAGPRFGDREAWPMVFFTCRKMARGGIHDHLGGGFARYSVDARWLVPHFEKMLYDNAQLLGLYLDASLAGGDDFFAQVARGIIGYVRRDLTHAEGGFFSAEDADSEGKEGKFYCWTAEELRRLLTPPEFALAARYFGVSDEGNFVDHSDPAPLAGQNVLSLAEDELAEADKPLLASAVAKMRGAREKRIRPHRDDKVLSSWNGLMLASLARAAVVLQDEGAARDARRNADFIRARLWDAEKRRLYHRWREGERDQVQLLDAYAFQLYGQLSLYESALRTEDLEFCVTLAEAMLELFYDPAAGGFWQSREDADLILRIKEDYDGAEPSGNSVAALSLLKLADITGRADFREAAERTLRLFADRLTRTPQAMPFLLLALDYWCGEADRVVITGHPALAEVQTLLRAAHSVYHPRKVVLGTSGPVAETARKLSAAGGPPAAYVCTGMTCQAPVREPAQLRQILQASLSAAAQKA